MYIDFSNEKPCNDFQCLAAYKILKLANLQIVDQTGFIALKSRTFEDLAPDSALWLDQRKVKLFIVCHQPQFLRFCN